jgi:hypothetical protein
VRNVMTDDANPEAMAPKLEELSSRRRRSTLQAAALAGEVGA